MAGAAAPRALEDERLTRELITPEGVDLRIRLGSAGERAGAFMLDVAIIVLTLVGMTLLAMLVFAGTGLKAAEFLAVLWLIGFFLLRCGYFIIFELMPRAATPGKMALGLRVAARDGGRLTSEAIFARNAMREIEIFLPLTFLAASAGAGENVDGWLALLGFIWSGVFLFFPLFNRDRLRAGDFIAGTWVVKAPRRVLAIDLAQDAAQSLPRFAFTADQVGAYGVKELHVLEDVLRRRDRRTMTAVADRIRTKIGWHKAETESDADFLSAYYAALRGRLETRLLFGHRRKDKFDKA
ncbi:MAG TPA: RDD family protein [Caulobacteraceae bacterium]|nr:RDD family protein [Caulobacteraceae bacterium]